MKLFRADFSEGCQWGRRFAAGDLISIFARLASDKDLEDKLYDSGLEAVLSKMKNSCYNET